MDVLFENAFPMTRERYLEFCDRPVAQKAKRRLLLWKLLNGAAAAVMLCFAAYSAFYGAWLEAGLLLLLGLLFLYRLLFQRRQRNQELYRRSLTALGGGEWTRTTRFADDVRVRDGNTESAFSYAQFSHLSEDGVYFYLWLDKSMVMRLPKGRFTVGNEADFRAFVEKRLADAKTQEEKV